jgi:thiol:disulfide interchange protein
MVGAFALTGHHPPKQGDHRMTKNKAAALAAALAATTLAVTSLAFAQQPGHSGTQQTETIADAKARAPEVLVVAFHADWCAKCQTLGPKMMQSVFPEIKAEPYLLVKLDLTDRDSNQAEYMLSALGLGNLWEQYGRKTGFALVIDAQTKEVLHTINASENPEAMVADIRSAISG